MNSKQRRKVRRALAIFYGTVRKAVTKYVTATDISRRFETPLQGFLKENKNRYEQNTAE